MNASSRIVATAGAREPGPALFRLMAEQWPHAVLVLDRDLRVRWVNNACQALFKNKTIDLTSTFWSQLALPWTLGDEQLRSLSGVGELKLDAASLVGADGTRRLYTARFVPLRETPNLITAILCVIEEAVGHTTTVP